MTKYYNEVKRVINLLKSGEYNSLYEVLAIVGMNDRTYKKHLRLNSDLTSEYESIDWKYVMKIKCSCCGVSLNELNYRHFNNIKSLSGASPNKFRKCNICFRDGLKEQRNNLQFKIEQLFRSAKSRAMKENMEFDINKEYLFSLWEIQNGRCKLTNDEMTFNTHCDNTVSLDRIHNDKGYIIGNICLTTWEVNWTKRNLEFNKFLNICKKVTIAN